LTRLIFVSLLHFVYIMFIPCIPLKTFLSDNTNNVNESSMNHSVKKVPLTSLLELDHQEIGFSPEPWAQHFSNSFSSDVSPSSVSSFLVTQDESMESLETLSMVSNASISSSQSSVSDGKCFFVCFLNIQFHLNYLLVQPNPLSRSPERGNLPTMTTLLRNYLLHVVPMNVHGSFPSKVMFGFFIISFFKIA